MSKHNGFSSAYGNFWQTDFITVAPGDAFPWSNSGPMKGGVFLSSPTDIHVTNAGDYYVTYTIDVALAQFQAGSFDINAAITVNGTVVPNTQTNFGLSETIPNDTLCAQIHGEAIITIPANSTLNLINARENNIPTCDFSKNAASINIIKLGRAS